MYEVIILIWTVCTHNENSWTVLSFHSISFDMNVPVKPHNENKRERKKEKRNELVNLQYCLACILIAVLCNLQAWRFNMALRNCAQMS